MGENDVRVTLIRKRPPVGTFPPSTETPQKTEQQKVNSTCIVDCLSSLHNFNVEANVRNTYCMLVVHFNIHFFLNVQVILSFSKKTQLLINYNTIVG